MDKEKLIQLLWKDHHIRGRKCPRNHIAISFEMKEAMLDMRTFRYSDPFRYHKALKIYNSLCKERDERTHIEELANKILEHENNDRINKSSSRRTQNIDRPSK